MVEGDTLLPHRASVISSTRRTDTPARYISMRASSTLLSRRRYRSIIAVSKEIPLSLGTFREMCIRDRLRVELERLPPLLRRAEVLRGQAPQGAVEGLEGHGVDVVLSLIHI